MRRFLIVDDNEPFAENLAEILRDGGDEVSLAFSGREALALAREHRFDALLSDMRMPVMGGAELVHQVRGIDPGLPAIVITAYTNDDDLHAARHEGLLAVLPKPVPIGELVQLLSVARRDGLVALVEDDVKLADNLGEALARHGFSGVTAGSVLETERLGDVRPFAALVDLRMPGGPDGAAMKELAAKYPGLPIYVISAHTNETKPPVPYRRLYPKPFDTAALVAELDRLHRGVA